MMSLTVRKTIVLQLIGTILLLVNILVVANWISDTGISEKAVWAFDFVAVSVPKQFLGQFHASDKTVRKFFDGQS